MNFWTSTTLQQGKVADHYKQDMLDYISSVGEATAVDVAWAMRGKFTMTATEMAFYLDHLPELELVNGNKYRLRDGKT